MVDFSHIVAKSREDFAKIRPTLFSLFMDTVGKKKSCVEDIGTRKPETGWMIGIYPDGVIDPANPNDLNERIYGWEEELTPSANAFNAVANTAVAMEKMRAEALGIPQGFDADGIKSLKKEDLEEIVLYSDMSALALSERGNIYYLLGKKHREVGEYEKALECYKSAFDFYKSAIGVCEYGIETITEIMKGLGNGSPLPEDKAGLTDVLGNLRNLTNRNAGSSTILHALKNARDNAEALIDTKNPAYDPDKTETWVYQAPELPVALEDLIWHVRTADASISGVLASAKGMYDEKMRGEEKLDQNTGRGLAIGLTRAYSSIQTVTERATKGLERAVQELGISQEEIEQVAYYVHEKLDDLIAQKKDYTFDEKNVLMRASDLQVALDALLGTAESGASYFYGFVNHAFNGQPVTQMINSYVNDDLVIEPVNQSTD